MNRTESKASMAKVLFFNYFAINNKSCLNFFLPITEKNKLLIYQKAFTAKWLRKKKSHQHTMLFQKDMQFQFYLECYSTPQLTTQIHK